MNWTRIGAGSLIGASVAGIAAAAASALIPGVGDLASTVAAKIGMKVSSELTAGVLGAAAGAVAGSLVANFTGNEEEASGQSTMDNIGDALKKAGVSVATEGAQKILKALPDDTLAKVGQMAKTSAGIA